MHKGRMLTLKDVTVKLSNGVISKREIVEHPGAVAVIAVTKDKKMILIKQFRKSAEKVMIEIPAGLVHKGERDIDGARRELIEETGYTAGKIKKIFWGFSSPGYSTEILKFFLATGLKRSNKHAADFDEMITTDFYPIRKCLRMLKQGKIKDNKTAIGILLANLWIH